MDLKSIIINKKTRLCFSADFTKKKELFDWIEKMGVHICILKTHIDILEDFEESVIERLISYKKKYNFLILEDRKFSDIGKTFYKQLFRGIYKINQWADLITIHGITAIGMLNYLNTLDMNLKIPKILIVSQMSSQKNLISFEYTLNCHRIAKKFPNLVTGFISQNKFLDDGDFLFLTPGVKYKNCQEIDQKYRTPKEAIERDKNDIIIVGSGIYENPNLQEVIENYKIY